MTNDEKQSVSHQAGAPPTPAPLPLAGEGKTERGSPRAFWRRGEPQVWVTSAALTIMLFLIILLLWVVLWNGLGVFWPARVAEVTLKDGKKLLGERIRGQINPDTDVKSIQFKTGNRDLDPHQQDFHWVEDGEIRSIEFPPEVYVLERTENGNFYGFLRRLEGPDLEPSETPVAEDKVRFALKTVRRKSAEEIAPISEELRDLGRRLQNARRRIRRLEHRGDDERLAELRTGADDITRKSDELVGWQRRLLNELRRNVVVTSDAGGREKAIALLDVVRFYKPNEMGFWAKCRYYLLRLGELFWENPRESNTEGGLFPAIFGTVMLIFLMAAACFPLGVLAGVYLGEYAKDGPLVRAVRIAVNNLAGIPSIVYGIFGLGFFVYGIGGLIDAWFFPESAAAGEPVFGTGGILWASITLGILTVPVVIVSTEEALRAIPRGVREGSLALGATKFQTLVRVLVPMASPGMMTGFILAMARAAGEVAPLMITGVVKLAPQLPLDGEFPFFHLDRKFMHLGFHIYDVGFQSPNVEASKPMVYVTTLLLLSIVLAMSSAAIVLRNRMRKRFLARTI
ncbi:MAG: phosphate ABC transporter permease PstA [Pirellulales bacterium]|nr:phosphate ABC transporter permease PstA [Pirellulales bacterium]